MKTQMTCANCAFYHSSGHCRRFPPSQEHDRWPTMDQDKWCGEHKPAGEMAAKDDNLKARIAAAVYQYPAHFMLKFGYTPNLSTAILDHLTKHLQERI